MPSLTTQPVLAQSNTRQDVAFEAQPLAQALNALGARFDVTIFAADELTNGQTGGPLSGALTLEEALRRLLADTGLIARRTSGGAYVVVREGETASDPSAIVVSGQNVRRTVQETSDSVAVLTGDIVDDSYITNLREVLQRAPNVFADPNGSGFSIRGIPERGVGSGTGKTAGRGHKGYGSRSGNSNPHEGGAIPMWKRFPKRGFSNAEFMTHYAIVNLKAIDARFNDGEEVNAESLVKLGLIRDTKRPLKILGDLGGAESLSVKFDVVAERVTDPARKHIEGAGGSVKELGSRRDNVRGIDRNSDDRSPKNLTKKPKNRAAKVFDTDGGKGKGKKKD